MNAGTLVKPAQSRDTGGWSVIYRADGGPWGRAGTHVYVKTQHHYFCHPLWRLGLPTMLLRRELRALRAAARLSLPVPEVIFFREEDDVCELVIEEVTDADTLHDALLGADATTRLELLQATAWVIGRIHASGWTHGSLAETHILVKREGQRTPWFIDWEKARWAPHARKADLARFFRRTQVVTPEERRAFLAAYRSARRQPR